MERDQALAQEAGVDVIFTPQASHMYPAGYQTYVEVKNVTQNLCGLSRPNHFKGVTTVVCKLFCIVKPDCAIFGEKDFQQLAVIRQMVADLNFDIEIVGMPIYREEDGLAMSSRNKYLKPDERKAALCIINSLRKAEGVFDAGEREGKKIVNLVKNGIEAEPLSRIDYIKICDASTIEDIDQIRQKAVLAVAVNIGKARLIDNVVLDPLTSKDC
jgi:pantoate--beta-alanine ligase